jgi:hypothetical protein
MNAQKASRQISIRAGRYFIDLSFIIVAGRGGAQDIAPALGGNAMKKSFGISLTVLAAFGVSARAERRLDRCAAATFNEQSRSIALRARANSDSTSTLAERCLCRFQGDHVVTGSNGLPRRFPILYTER